MAVSMFKFMTIFTVTMVTLNGVYCEPAIDVNGIQEMLSLLGNIADSSATVSSILPHLGSLLKNHNDLQTLNNALLENNTAITDDMVTFLPNIQEFMQLALEQKERQHDKKTDSLENQMNQTQTQMAAFQLQMTSIQSQTLNAFNQMASTQTQMLNTLNEISKSQTQLANYFSQVASILAAQNQFNLTEAPLTTAPLSIQDCSDLVTRGGDHPSSTYTITLRNGSLYDVYCDMVSDGGGWTVVQKRFNGAVDFYRGWDDYVGGFGHLDGEFWLGLEIIHQLTSSGSWELQVQLVDFNANTAYANYQSFSIGDAASKYRLTYGSYSGTAGATDSLSLSNYRPFSTKDRDHDDKSFNCAETRRGAWWYGYCSNANLNGQYLGASVASPTGMYWYFWKSSWQSIKSSTMMIRRIQ